MNVQLGVGLIIGGFVLPIILGLIIRKIVKDRRQKLKGKIYNKEGHKR